MSRRGLPVFVLMVGAVAGTLLHAGLLSPAAHADDIATLPVPPFDPFDAYFSNGPLGPPAVTGGPLTNEETSTIFGGHQTEYDQALTVSDGSYQTHLVYDVYGAPTTYFEHDSTVVTASEGVAPPVGTEWDTSYYWLPSWPYTFELYINSSMTTSAGTVDVFTPENIPFLDGWSNEFYQGPAGIFDDLVSNNGATVIPILDIPATASTGAAADISTLWSEVVGTL